MASGGGFQNEVIVNSIRVNPPMSGESGQACEPASGAVAPVPEPVPAAPPAPGASGDGVTRMVQEHLTALGYSTGNTAGELSTETVVAISQFQAENNMPVTGEPSPQLAGILAAKVSAANGPPQRSAEELQAAQQACLQKKMEEAQQAQKTKRGLGRLVSGIGRIAARTGDYDVLRKTNDIYSASATADDLSQAAKDLGLTEDDVEACRNPG